MSARLGLIVAWLICLACAVIGLIWMAIAIIAGADRAWNIALGFDRLGNAITGGDDGEYISSRCWRYRDDWRYAILRRLVDAAFSLDGQVDHCRKSYEWETARAAARAGEI